MMYNNQSSTGVWRSWLARAVWDREVEGSSPFTPTMEEVRLLTPGFFHDQDYPYLFVMTRIDHVLPASCRAHYW